MVRERRREHRDEWRRREPSNPQTKHYETNHKQDGEIPEYQMALVKCFKTALQRQIYEAVKINQLKCDFTMNSRSEWNHQPIPRIKIQVREKIESMDLEGRMQKKSRQRYGRKEEEEKREKKRKAIEEDCENEEIEQKRKKEKEDEEREEDARRGEEEKRDQ